MKCWVCGESCYDDATDCPGICPKSECRAVISDPEKLAQFEADKQEFIFAAWRAAPGGRPYVHFNFRDKD